MPVRYSLREYRRAWCAIRFANIAGPGALFASRISQGLFTRRIYYA